MYKPYSDSYLMTKSKKTLIEYLRIAEHNQRVCEETLDQQAKNCTELLKEERAKAIDEFVAFANTMPTIEDDGVIRPMWLEEMAKQLKGDTDNGTR